MLICAALSTTATTHNAALLAAATTCSTALLAAMTAYSAALSVASNSHNAALPVAATAHNASSAGDSAILDMPAKRLKVEGDALRIKTAPAAAPEVKQEHRPAVAIKQEHDPIVAMELELAPAVEVTQRREAYTDVPIDRLPPFGIKAEGQVILGPVTESSPSREYRDEPQTLQVKSEDMFAAERPSGQPSQAEQPSKMFCL